MARITVEDCIDKFPSRFELVLVASNRARKLHAGETPTVDKDNDKNTVIALREIAQETVTKDQLKNDLVEEYQTVSITEEEELEELDQIDNSEEITPENSDEVLLDKTEEINRDSSEEINIENINIDDSSNSIDENNTENLQSSEEVIDK